MIREHLLSESINCGSGRNKKYNRHPPATSALRCLIVRDTLLSPSAAPQCKVFYIGYFFPTCSINNNRHISANVHETLTYYTLEPSLWIFIYWWKPHENPFSVFWVYHKQRDAAENFDFMICSDYLKNNQQNSYSEDHRRSLFEHHQHQVLAPARIVRLLHFTQFSVSLLHQVGPWGVVGWAAGDWNVRGEVVWKLWASVVFGAVDTAAVQLEVR